MSDVAKETTISPGRAGTLFAKYPAVYGAHLSAADRASITDGTTDAALVIYSDGRRDIVKKSASKKIKKAVVAEEPVVEIAEIIKAPAPAPAPVVEDLFGS